MKTFLNVLAFHCGAVGYRKFTALYTAVTGADLRALRYTKRIMSFVRQHPLVWTFIRILLFQKSPDVIPASWFLLGILLVLNLGLGIVSFAVQYDVLDSVLRTLADMLISICFVYLVLMAVNKSARSLQTISAMLGVSIILNLLSLPLLMMLAEKQLSAGFAGLFLYIIFCWHIAVMGHIFRHALSVRLAVGMMVSFVYILVAMAIFYSLFPVQ